MTKVEESHRFYYLDALRGIAAFLVFLFHIHNANYFIMNGFWLAVDLFFILSGFVLFPQIIKIDKNNELMAFVTKRLIRLMPLPILTIFFMCFRQRNSHLQMIKYVEPSNVLAIVCALLFLQLFSAQAVSVNLTLWSLSTEFWANFLSGKYHSKNNIKLIILSSSIILSLSIFAGLPKEYGLFAISRTCLSFNIGLLLRNYSNMFKYNRNYLILSIFLLFPLFNFGGHSNFAIFLAIPIFSVLVLEISKIQQYNLSKKNRNFCKFLGRNSFGIYVWQVPINSLVQSQHIEHFFHVLIPNSLTDILVVMIKFSVLLTISELTTRFYEGAVQKLIRNFFYKFLN